MRENIFVNGLVIKSTPIGEYDKRVVLLTMEKGKITAFARGAKRAGSKFMGTTQPFCTGRFKLYASGNSYQLLDAEITEYFEELKSDLEQVYLGMYFLEIMDYFTRENNDEARMLKLLYQSLKVITRPAFDKELVRCVFEIKGLMINGEYPGVPRQRNFLPSTMYTMDYLYNTSIEKLYTFKLSDEVLEEIIYIASYYKKHYYDKEFNSLEILKSL